MAAIIIALIYWEQTALLYVLATLGLTALLIVVAVANLGGTRRILNEPSPADDAAAIGMGISSTLPSGSASSTRGAAKRR